MVLVGTPNGKSSRKPADGKTCNACGKTGHHAKGCWQRQGQAEGKSDGKSKGKAKGKNGGKGDGKVNNPWKVESLAQ